MVDREKRRTLKRAGIAGGILGGGGFGIWRTHDWVTGWDNDLDPRSLEKEIEAEVQGQRWNADTIIVSGVEAELEHQGVTEKDGDIYTATVTAPLRTDVDYTVCDHTRGRHELELADTLREEAELLFDGLYDVAGRYAEPRRIPEEDRITAYTLRFEDDGGVAGIALSAEETDYITEGRDEYHNWRDVRNRFMQAYGEAFDARCLKDG